MFTSNISYIAHDVAWATAFLRSYAAKHVGLHCSGVQRNPPPIAIEGCLFGRHVVCVCVHLYLYKPYRVGPFACTYLTCYVCVLYTHTANCEVVLMYVCSILAHGHSRGARGQDCGTKQSNERVLLSGGSGT